MHVLIIEDDPLIGMELQFLMEELGAQSTALIGSQEQAIEEATAHRPDLITSDVQLSEGNGLDAVKLIREKLGEIPVIYVTGNPDEARRLDPSAPVLEKPVRWLALVHATSAFGLPPHEPIDLGKT